MLKCKILGRNLINGVEQEFNITEGAVFTENYNETLDTSIFTEEFHEMMEKTLDTMRNKKQ